jgi:hypothetical protein
LINNTHNRFIGLKISAAIKKPQKKTKDLTVSYIPAVGKLNKKTSPKGPMRRRYIEIAI